jgi:uncharacterized metal-binding protein YceD (DUF177 family)
MDEAPKLSGGSTRIDLRGIREGTHPVVLDGGETPLTLDRKAGRTLRRHRFEGSLVWTTEDRRVRGFLSGTLETRCDRCLAAFDRDFRSEIDLPVRWGAPPSETTGAGPSGDEPAAVEEELVLPAGAVELDLADVFRQAALLEVPIKNVCRDDCRGICATCGADLNHESCSHDQDSRDPERPGGDPRWDALRRLSLPADPKE